MVGALWTGISGLSGAQTGLDNESNNIANVNTIGYKASTVSFADQVYQNKIGKGVTASDVEKDFTQGSLNVTGVSYDLALNSDGFFMVEDGNDTYYTRAGNFKMGESGTLQTTTANEVQGWAIAEVTADDIISTDSNATFFTSDYSKILGNKIIEDSTTIETIATKATDYNASATSDSLSVFSGAGYKTASSKKADVEALITQYNAALAVYAEADPKPTASSSSTQKDLLNFPLTTGSELAEGDEVYVYIDGVKYSTSWDTDNETTMKNMADEISNATGFKSYLTDDASSPYDVDSETAPELGYLVIEGILPGESYNISEFGWTDASNSNAASKADVVNVSLATLGTGLGHIESIEEALAEAVAGKQMDVYSPDEIAFNETTRRDNTYTYQISIYDSELGENVTVPASPLTLDNGTMTVDTDESAVVTFAAMLEGETVTVGDVTYTAPTGGSTADDAASYFNTAGNIPTGYSSGGSTSPVTYTSTSSNSNVTDLEVSDTIDDYDVTVVITDGGLAGDAIGYAGSTEEEESASIDAIALAINSDPDLSEYVEAYNFNGNLVVKTLDSNNDVEFTGTLKTTIPVQETQTITLSGDVADTSDSGEFTFLGTNISITASTAYTADEIADEIITNVSDVIATWNEENPTRLISSITKSGTGVLEITYESGTGNVATINASTSNGISFGESVETQTGRASGELIKNANYSGTEGAGAEFLQIKTTINQTASKSEIQLRLDSLGITDSAFGDFSVDESGIITMTQDGVDFAVGQVAIARFTDNLGLEAVGDNLFKATTDSGTAIFSTGNSNAAEISGGTLELSTADLSESLVNLMVFQRAFEANAKSITTADEILTTLIGLKR